MKFVDLQTQFQSIEPEIRRAIDGVLAHGQFIMGPEVDALERDLAAYCDAKHAITAASGTDALLMALLAYRVGPGDAVIVPPFTFVATAEVVRLIGATPVFADVCAASFNINPDQIRAAITQVRVQTESGKLGELNLRGIIAVDLFGLPAQYREIQTIAAENELFLIADAAQSFGAIYHGEKVGSLGDITATSFFPAKPLGGYGDGGALFTQRDDLAELLRSIRIHGMGDTQYDNVRIGITGRMDSIQAAVLRCKLRIFEQELTARRRIAQTYTEALASPNLADVVQTPQIPAGLKSAWAQYTVRSPNRDALRAHLHDCGIPTAVYYPRPLHQQLAFRDAVTAQVSMPISEQLATQVLSLPVHPYLRESEQAQVIDAVRGFRAN